MLTVVVEDRAGGTGTGDRCDPDVQNPDKKGVGIGVLEPITKLHVKSGSIFLDSSGSLIIRSANGACWGLKATDAGDLELVRVDCPQ